MSIFSKVIVHKATSLGRLVGPWKLRPTALAKKSTNSNRSRWFDPENIEIVEIALSLTDLPAALKGTRFAQISDIHLSRFMKRDDLKAVIDLANHLSPEFLLITGDFVSGEEHAEELVAPLCHVAMPTYGILGNHDSGFHEWSVTQALRKTPVQLLRNRSVWIKESLWLTGLDDAFGSLPRLKHALTGVPPNATTLLMAHEPDLFRSVVAAEYPIAAQFSGHTHGGQIRLPALRADHEGRHSWAPVLPTLGRLFPMGLYVHNKYYLYTNRGIGYSGLPIRFNCPPEITLFTLV